MTNASASLTPGRPRVVVIVPGNPGDAAFYDDFVAQLGARGHDTAIASHPCLESPPDMLAYARHQAASVRQHLEARGRAPEDVELVLVGHSVGAYLSYLLVAHGLLPVTRVIMLFPFLMRPALLGRLLLGAVSVAWLVRLVLGLFRRLPGVIQRWLVRGAGAADLVPAALALLGSPQALGCARMAARERVEIAARADAGYLFDHPLFRDHRRFAVLLCAGDVWAPPALGAQLPGAHTLPPPIGHAFVVDSQQCRVVAEAVHQILVGARQPGRTATNVS